MEIRVRTADEFRDAHVVIEVRAEEGEDVRVRPLVADGYPSELDWAAVRAERDEARERAARRERKIEELTAELAEQRQHNNRLKLGNDELARTVTRLREELASERQRATENREWAERAESRVASAGLKLADARRAIDILSGQLGRISGAVHGQELVQTALRTDWTSWSEREAAALTGAIRQVRDALGSPSPPGSPKPVTSQA
jgi:predicted RNase H-like nuclease (RuvC/YqgF family)